MEDITSTNGVRFGPFELDSETGELRKHGTRVKISGQAIQVLIVLTAVPGEMVSREVLKKKLWPGATSGDFEHGLNAAVNRLREVLGDSATDPIYVETIPGRGYRFIGRLVDDAAVPPSVAVPVQEPRARRSWSRIASIVAVLVVGSLFLLRGPIERTWRLYERQHFRVSRLTSLPGVVTSPSFSPDGSQIAFAWNPDGNGFDLYVKALASDVPHRLTNHPSTWFSVAWAPNGQSIATAHMTGGAGSGIYLISPWGGPERKIADRSERKWYGQELSWSPDSRHLAYIDRPDSLAEARLELSVLSLDTLQKHRVETGCVSSGTPAFSPRGRYLAWVCNHGMCASTIEVLRLRDQQRTRVYEDGACIEGIGWSKDERRILFSSKADSGSLHEVEVDPPNQVETLSIGQDAADISVRPNGDGFAYVKGTYNATIWRVDLGGATPDGRRLIASSQMDEAPNFSPDGNKIAFESSRSGDTEVWMCDADGSNAQQLSFFGNVTGSPRWSPDGKLILFDSRVEGASNLYVVSPEGGVPRKIDVDIRGNSLPSWSHDGKWIYFTNGDDEGRTSIWKVPSGGGHAIQLAGVGSRYSQESADGSLLYLAKGDTLWSVRVDGGGEQLVEGMPKTNFLGDEWVPTEQGIYFLAHRDNRTLVQVFDLKSKDVRTVAALPKQTPPWIGAMAISRDGRSLLLPEVDIWSSDVMMMEGWK